MLSGLRGFYSLDSCIARSVNFVNVLFSRIGRFCLLRDVDYIFIRIYKNRLPIYVNLRVIFYFVMTMMSNE